MTKPSSNRTPPSLHNIGDSWQDAPATTQHLTQPHTTDSDCDTETLPDLTCWWDSDTEDDETDSDTNPSKRSRVFLTQIKPVENNSDNSDRTPKRKCNLHNTGRSPTTPINKRSNRKYPPTHQSSGTPQGPRIHTSAHTTPNDGFTHADRISLSDNSDHSNIITQSMPRPVDRDESHNTHSPLLVPTQVLTATSSLAPLQIEGLAPVQDSHTRGLQDNVYIGDVMGLPKPHTTT